MTASGKIGALTLLSFSCLAFCCLPAFGQESDGSDRPAVSSNALSALDLHSEVQFDMRAQAPTKGKVLSQLFSSMVTLRGSHAGRIGKVGINLLGLNQYGSFRWQQATVDLEVGQAGRFLPQRIQAGMLRLPFGIYDFRETYCSGLIGYALPRNDFAYSAVDWGVPGVQWTGGTSRFQVEAAGFNGKSVGIWGNEQGLDGAIVRVQTYLPPGLVMGMSDWRGNQALFPGMAQRRRVDLGGLDFRYTTPFVVLRGEAIAGTLSGNTMQGAYVDAYYRIPSRERLTLVSRVEYLKPATNEPTARQVTLGGRWNIDADWMLAMNWRRNNIERAYAFTWTTISGPRGELLLQVWRRYTLF